MMLSSLSRGAAAAVRVLFVLYIFSFCVDVAVAAPDAPHLLPARGVGRRSPQPQPQPRPTPQPHAHHPQLLRPRGETPDAGTGGRATPPGTVPGAMNFAPSSSPASSSSSTTPFPESTAPPVTPEGEVFTQSWLIPSTVVVGQSASVEIVSPPTEHADASNLILCLTSAGDASDMTDQNTWFVLSLEDTMPSNNQGYSLLMPLNIPTGASPLSNENSFFLCWASKSSSGNYVCEAYSPSFVVVESPARRRSPPMPRRGAGGPVEVQLVPRFTGAPQQVLTITQTSTALTISGTQVLPALTTVTSVTSTQWITGTSTPSSDADPAGTAKSSSSKLGIGPIVGIAVGGVAVLAILAFLIFACLRRRRNGSEARHTLLRDDASGPRDMIHGTPAEKHISVAPAVPMLSFLETRPTSNPFDHLELSEPYSGPAGPMHRSRPSSSAPTPVPTASTAASAGQGATLGAGAIGIAASAGAGAAALVARRSVASTIPEAESPVVPDNMTEVTAPLSPRSTTRSVSAYSVPYSDNPMYGDVPRHAPQLYESPSQTPFLSEPGMSAEELSRLEEEERRIDAAIAEAEAAGRR